MTNGEKIIEIFPNINIYEHGSTYSINNEYNFNASWWNAEFKEPTTENDLELIHTEGLDEEIRCTMCTNNMKSDRGCDGSCVVDKDMYKAVMDAIEKRIQPTTKNTIAQERYQDLIDYFGDKEVAKTILENRKEFKAWLERLRWHVKRADELARELEQIKGTTKNDLPHCQYSDEEIAKSFIEDVEAVKDQLPCGEQMDFPNTFDEFAKDYGFKDKDEVYTNGSELIPVFRVKQWLEHISTTKNDIRDNRVKNELNRVKNELESTTKNSLGVDCISREQAIQTIQRYGVGCFDADEFSPEECERFVIGKLNDLPSVTPQEPRWIPVSERLPEDGQFVLFCDIDDDSMVGYHVKGRPNTHFLQVGIFEDMKNVRAWMPLPKPYQPQESEDKE